MLFKWYVSVGYVPVDIALINVHSFQTFLKQQRATRIFRILSESILEVRFSMACRQELVDLARNVCTVGTFFIALVMTKISEPVRLAFTVAVVPSIARFLGKAPKPGKT